MLRRHAELAGLKSDFTILDTDDQIRLMKQIIQAEGIDEKRWPARQLAGLIDHWKNRGLAPADVPEVDGRAFADGRGKKLYAAYQARLKVLNAADFGDLVLEPLTILREQPGRARRLSRAASATCWSTSIRTPTSRSICGCGCWRRRPRPAADRRPTSAASATTTSRSMAGAAPRSTTSCASRRIFPAPRSSAWSATTARPRISSAPPRTSSPTMRAGSARRCSPTTTTRTRCASSVASSWDSRAGSPRHRRGDRAAPAQGPSR